MTRDDIIRMAHEAQGEALSHKVVSMHVEDLERFAALIEAETRHACADILETLRRSYRVNPPNASIFFALHLLWAHFKNTSRPLGGKE